MIREKVAIDAVKRKKWVDGKMGVYLYVLYSGPSIPLVADGWMNEWKVEQVERSVCERERIAPSYVNL